MNRRSASALRFGDISMSLSSRSVSAEPIPASQESKLDIELLSLDLMDETIRRTKLRTAHRTLGVALTGVVHFRFLSHARISSQSNCLRKYSLLWWTSFAKPVSMISMPG